jgi:hypothetical protein
MKEQKHMGPRGQGRIGGQGQEYERTDRSTWDPGDMVRLGTVTGT